MTPDVGPEDCRRCWTRIDIGLGPCSKHQEPRPSPGLRGVERTRDALAEGVAKKTVSGPDTSTEEQQK